MMNLTKKHHRSARRSAHFPPRKRPPTQAASSAPVRRISPTPTTRLRLCTYAAGWCQFDGCDKFLLEHPVTKHSGLFGEAAHVVAFQRRGPRGGRRRPVDINDIANLMLLCAACHKLIDDNPDRYSVETLTEMKCRQQARIHYLGSLRPDHETVVLLLKAKIGGEVVDVNFADIASAVAPRYPADRTGHTIDLTRIEGDDKAYYETARRQIDLAIDRLYAPRMDGTFPRHISVFALAPIPLLMHLGSRLSDKIPVDSFQRHRDTENWIWKSTAPSAAFEFRELRAGTNQHAVALVLSLSGTIETDRLPQNIDSSFFVYELSLSSTRPTPLFLKTRADLEEFRRAYQGALREVEGRHDGLGELHLFPAVPAPVAVLCGRERSTKTDPVFIVYDNDRRNGGFTPAMTIA
ncbi:MAG: SAVED domain-containing protein [Myxococcota bacterium]